MVMLADASGRIADSAEHQGKHGAERGRIQCACGMMTVAFAVETGRAGK